MIETTDPFAALATHLRIWASTRDLREQAAVAALIEEGDLLARDDVQDLLVDRTADGASMDWGRFESGFGNLRLDLGERAFLSVMRSVKGSTTLPIGFVDFLGGRRLGIVLRALAARTGNPGVGLVIAPPPVPLMESLLDTVAHRVRLDGTWAAVSMPSAWGNLVLRHLATARKNCGPVITDDRHDTYTVIVSPRGTEQWPDAPGVAITHHQMGDVLSIPGVGAAGMERWWLREPRDPVPLTDPDDLRTAIESITGPLTDTEGKGELLVCGACQCPVWEHQGFGEYVAARRGRIVYCTDCCAGDEHVTVRPGWDPPTGLLEQPQ
ncbi:hypothetical protein ACFWIA_22785 [Streptomyces sp. NPDC127068]|uniref:hypothetical protein n=1 Tax=Streptomyces sp. NPDC127068 TaxID=3347127 RepID=UPI0036670A07